MEARPVSIVAPWYRPRSDFSGASSRVMRGTAPIFQKYEAPPVNDFLADPEHSLHFTDDDFVWRSSPSYARTNIRKLFLDVHKRFYLVVCEMHCDAPGFPNASRDEICEQGFVVRRRRVVFPSLDAKLGATKILADLNVFHAQLDKISGSAKAKPSSGAANTLLAKGLALEVITTGLDQTTLAKKAEVQAQITGVTAQLFEYANAVKARQIVEGWVPSPKGLDKVGAWVELDDETPEEITEETYPLYPLIPDPTIAGHAGAGRSIYFGLVPTNSAEHDKYGTTRFDSVTLYEIRCYARRRKEGCVECHGPLYWSERTERYQLAPHFDLTGTNNRPVTVTIPDFAELEAQAQATPIAMAPFRIKASQSLTSTPEGEFPTGGSVESSFQICSFHIPLITIVATFVFKLFLPIVTLLFGLFWMLRLKLCIPPSFDVDVQLNLALTVKPPQVQLELSLDVSTSFGAAVKEALSLQYGDEAADALINNKDSNGKQMTAGQLYNLAVETQAAAKKAQAESDASSSSTGSSSGSVDSGTSLVDLDYYDHVKAVA